MPRLEWAHFFNALTSVMIDKNQGVSFNLGHPVQHHIPVPAFEPGNLVLHVLSLSHFHQLTKCRLRQSKRSLPQSR